jgi:hypothetical protein
MWSAVTLALLSAGSPGVQDEDFRSGNRKGQRAARQRSVTARYPRLQHLTGYQGSGLAYTE